MKWWAARKSLKFFLTAPGWAKLLMLILLVPVLLLFPILGLLAGVILLVVGLLALVVWPVRRVSQSLPRPWK